MSRILVIQPDAVFAALVEDRLREAGHEVELCEDADQALAAASRSWSDVVVLDLGLSMAAGGGLVRAIRELNEERSIRVLALSDPLPGEERVEVLRAGADDLLERPIHLEELVLRVDRLSRSGRTAPVELEGSLASYPLWELLQPLVDSRRRGRLMVWDRRGGGSLTLGAGGRVVAASWEKLSGPEALLALLGLEEGGFRFIAGEQDEPAAAGEAPVLEIQRALLEAAWLKDELDRRAEFLPATGQPLSDSGFTLLPRQEPDLPPLPVDEVLERVRSKPGTRLFDLLAENLAAPLRVRLAVAWLREKGVLVAQARSRRRRDSDTTLEIARHEVLDAALDDLLRVVRERGVNSSPVPILLLAEPPAWPVLRSLFTEVEGGWRPDELPPLMELLAAGSGGSTVLGVDEGELSLHVQLLDDSTVTRLSTIAPECAGAVVWLGPGIGSEPFRKVLKRFGLAEHGVGFVVAADADSVPALREEITQHDRWRVVPELPRNLLAVFRLIRGRESK